MLNFSPFIERCLSYLTDSPNAAPTDKKLAAWVELQHLSEEVADTFRRGSVNKVSFEDPFIRAHIERLVRKFDTWWQNTDKSLLDGE